MTNSSNKQIAYFSMEIALDPAMPTYAGGLGILAGDTIRSAADLKVPMLAVTLLHRRVTFVNDSTQWLAAEEPANGRSRISQGDAKASHRRRDARFMSVPGSTK